MSAWEKIKTRIYMNTYEPGSAEIIFREIDAARAEDAERLKQATDGFTTCSDCGLIFRGSWSDCPGCTAQAAAKAVSDLCVERDALKQAEREAFKAGICVWAVYMPEDVFNEYFSAWQQSRQPVSSDGNTDAPSVRG